MKNRCFDLKARILIAHILNKTLIKAHINRKLSGQRKLKPMFPIYNNQQPMEQMRKQNLR